ncbi:hypothetical protein GCM10028825_18540 [Spirosoma agri]
MIGKAGDVGGFQTQLRQRDGYIGFSTAKMHGQRIGLYKPLNPRWTEPEHNFAESDDFHE